MKKLIAALFLLATPSFAGTIGIKWTAVPNVPGATVSGYRVCYSTVRTTPQTYPSCDTVGLVTQTSLAVNDATTYYIAVKALSAEGQESEGWSNEVSGWAAPRITMAIPATVPPGVAREYTFTGANFMPDTSIRLTTGGTFVDASNVVVVSSTSVRGTATILTVGQPMVTVQIGAPDSLGRRVTGSANGLIVVTNPVRPGTVSGAGRSDAQ